jgi:hypothetical protein
VPDALPAVGFSDDAGVIASTLAAVAAHVTPRAKKRRCWTRGSAMSEAAPRSLFAPLFPALARRCITSSCSWALARRTPRGSRHASTERRPTSSPMRRKSVWRRRSWASDRFDAYDEERSERPRPRTQGCVSRRSVRSFVSSCA